MSEQIEKETIEKELEKEDKEIVRRRIKEERRGLVARLEDWLETPLLILGFVWLVLLVIELTGNLFYRKVFIVESIVFDVAYQLGRTHRLCNSCCPGCCTGCFTGAES